MVRTRIILLAPGLFRNRSVGFCWKGSFTIIGGVRSERVGELGRSLVWRYNGSFIDSLSGGFRGPALVYSGSRGCPDAVDGIGVRLVVLGPWLGWFSKGLF